jgi:hypothetical protein
MFPITGNVGGPGGRFLGLLPILKRGKQQTVTIARMARSMDTMMETIGVQHKDRYVIIVQIGEVVTRLSCSSTSCKWNMMSPSL